MEPKVSIIIPIFSEAQYIQPTLNSILDQTFKDFEIIFVDDASFDSSIKILQHYQKTDSRIKILETNGEGTAFAQNLGLQNALGKYVMFSKCGILMSANLLEYLVDIIENHKTTIVSCDYFDTNEYDFFSYCLSTPSQKKETLEQLNSKKYLKDLSNKNNHIFESTCILFNKLINKSALDNFSFDLNKFHCNQFAIFDLFKDSQTITHSNQILIANAFLDEYYRRTCFSYNDHEQIEFMQQVFLYLKKNKFPPIALKNTAIRLAILLYNIRLKLIHPYLDIFDLFEQKKIIDNKFTSIRNFLKTQYPNDEDNEEEYTFYFKRYKKLLYDEKFREKYSFLFIVPPRKFIPLEIFRKQKMPPT